MIGFAEDFPVEAFTAGLVWLAFVFAAEEVPVEAEDAFVEADAFPAEPEAVPVELDAVPEAFEAELPADALPVPLDEEDEAEAFVAGAFLEEDEVPVFAATAVEDAVALAAGLFADEVTVPEDAFPAELPLEAAFEEGVLLTTVFTVFGVEASLRPDVPLADVLPADVPVFFATWLPVPETRSANEEPSFLAP